MMKENDQPDFNDVTLGIDKHFAHIPTTAMDEKELLPPPIPPSDATDKAKNKKLEVINKARSIIRGERTLDSQGLKDLITELEKMEQFAYATEVLLVKLKVDESAGLTIKLKDHETLAKYIYKDHSLPSSFKFKRALRELTSREDLANTERCEALGLAGAIYKRKWQFDHQYKNLVLARHYYKRGFEKWKEFIVDYNNPARNTNKNDDGYNAINYAYINELMAVDTLEAHGKITGFTESIEERFREAEATRVFILQQFIEIPAPNTHQLKKSNYDAWVYSTVAEAYFGLGNYEQAVRFIKAYIGQPSVNRWEIRSFSQQMFSLAYLQEYCKKFQDKYQKTDFPFKEKLAAVAGRFNSEGINSCLELFEDLDADEEVSMSLQDDDLSRAEIRKEGKQGLALSGGGFRSALFHIGVLAALAEKDELRHVEVISCVSGGSIIGAYYYLKLKKLLESKADDEITRDDYITIVQEIEKDFVKGIQNNLRMRIFSNLFSNLKMFTKHYSRTHRLGELYEEYLFKPLIDIKRTKADIEAGKSEDAIYMSDLYINPKDVRDDFLLSIDNWKRKNKVPQLVLNATSLNTGHNWQFTASWMGEPPGNIQTDIDAKPRLRRMYYEEAPEPYKNFRLGYAVGASSCVPVMFQPMPMFDLYPGIDLQLIDGGVHDNQGIGALIEQECKNMIISDGSGQMATNTESTKNNASLFFRSDTILQERLRELQFLDIKQRNSTTQINRLVTVHLKSDLENNPISWKYCTDPPRSILYSNVSNNNNDLTKYGILRNVQLHLSQIRTDLDSFSDAESCALMYSGYMQINYEYKKENEDQFPLDEDFWQFSKIRPYLTLPDKAAKKEKVFKEASRVPFKVFYLSKTVKVIALALTAILLAWVIYLASASFEETLNYSILNITVKLLLITLAIFLVGLVSKVLASFANIKSIVRKKLAFIAILIVGWIVSNLYLLLLNGVYNDYGKLDDDK